MTRVYLQWILSQNSFYTSEKKNVIVDSYVKWKITDPQNFYRSSKGDERIGINRLSQIINDLQRVNLVKEL